MDELEVPLAHAGFQIDRHQALGEQIVARPMSAVIVRRRRLHRDVDEAEFLIDRDMRPHSGVAVVHPGIVFPRLIAEFARSRNGVKAPQLLAAPHIPSAHDTFRVVMRWDGRALPHRGPYDHHIPGHGRGRMDADLASLQIDLLVVAFLDADLDVEDAAVGEGRDHRTRLGVELDQAIAGSHVDDALVAAAIGPVGNPASRQLPRGDFGAVAFTQAVRPDQFTGLGTGRS